MVKTTLEPLIEVSKDGEWGKGEPFLDSVEMRVIRGTDFGAVRTGDVSGLPIRFIPRQVSNRKKLRPSDLLIETAGGSKDRPTGRTLYITKRIWTKSDLPFTCASFSRFIRIKPKVEADPLYLFWHLQWLYETQCLLKYHTQHTGVSRFQWTTFSTREMLELPDFESQKKIASILSAYDNLIENNCRRIKILEGMAQTLYQEWFVKFRFPGHQKVKMVNSPLGKIPEGWEIGKIDELVNICSGFAFKSNTFVNDAKYKVITIKNVKDGIFIDDSDSQIEEIPKNMPEHCFLYTGDILLSLTGNVGRACLVFGNNFLLNQRVAKLVPRTAVNRGFIYIMFRQADMQKKLEMISTGVAQQNLSPVQMGKMEIVIPPLSILDKFASFVEPICEQIISLYLRNRILRQTCDLLLPKLISGELDVSELDITIPEANA